MVSGSATRLESNGLLAGCAQSRSELLGIARFEFHEGKVEEFKRLSARAMEIVRAQDTGTLQYDTYFNDDESEPIVIERFRDSQALIEHGSTSRRSWSRFSRRLRSRGSCWAS
jgi:quinol monooxygenase YgiN